MSDDLTPEQAQELVEISQEAAKVPASIEAVMTAVEGIRKDAENMCKKIVELCGGQTERSGALVHCRSLAITKLEEVIHRINDAGQYKIGQITGDEQKQAVDQAMSKPGGLRLV